MTAVAQDEFLAQARTFINTRRQGEFGQEFSAVSISGLSEIYDIAYRVPTKAAADLDSLLGRLEGASIGIAGPRGTGKSMLIRHYCEYAEDSRAKQEDGVYREAPVHAEVTIGRQIRERSARLSLAKGAAQYSRGHSQA
jgi:predicted ATP-dependent serine protease